MCVVFQLSSLYTNYFCLCFFPEYAVQSPMAVSAEDDLRQFQLEETAKIRRFWVHVSVFFVVYFILVALILTFLSFVF